MRLIAVLAVCLLLSAHLATAINIWGLWKWLPVPSIPDFYGSGSSSSESLDGLLPMPLDRYDSSGSSEPQDGHCHETKRVVQEDPGAHAHAPEANAIQEEEAQKRREATKSHRGLRPTAHELANMLTPVRAYYAVVKDIVHITNEGVEVSVLKELLDHPEKQLEPSKVAIARGVFGTEGKDKAKSKAAVVSDTDIEGAAKIKTESKATVINGVNEKKAESIPSSAVPDEGQSSTAPLTVKSGADVSGDVAENGSSQNSNFDELMQTVESIRDKADAASRLLNPITSTIAENAGRDTAEPKTPVDAVAKKTLETQPKLVEGKKAQDTEREPTDQVHTELDDTAAKAQIKALIRDAALFYIRHELSPTEREWLRDSSLFRKRVHTEFADALIHQLLATINNDLTPHVMAFEAAEKDSGGVVESAMAVAPRLYRYEAEEKRWLPNEETQGALLKMEEQVNEYHWKTLAKEYPAASLGDQLARYEMPSVGPSLTILYDYVHQLEGEAAETRRNDSLHRNLEPFAELLHKGGSVKCGERDLLIMNHFYLSSAERALYEVAKQYCNEEKNVEAGRKLKKDRDNCEQMVNEIERAKQKRHRCVTTASEDGKRTNWIILSNGVYNDILYVLLSAYYQLRGECLSQMADLAASQTLIHKQSSLVEAIRQHENAPLNGIVEKRMRIEVEMSRKRTSAIRLGESRDEIVNNLWGMLSGTTTMTEPCTLIGYDFAGTRPSGTEQGDRIPEKMQTALRRIALLGELLAGGVGYDEVKHEFTFHYPGPKTEPEAKSDWTELTDAIQSGSRRFWHYLAALQLDMEILYPSGQKDEWGASPFDGLAPAQLAAHHRLAVLSELFSIFERAYNVAVIGWARDLELQPVEKMDSLISRVYTEGYAKLINDEDGVGKEIRPLPTTDYHLRAVVSHLVDGHVVPVPSTPEREMDRGRDGSRWSTQNLNKLLPRDITHSPSPTETGKDTPLGGQRLDFSRIHSEMKRVSSVVLGLTAIADFLLDEKNFNLAKMSESFHAHFNAPRQYASAPKSRDEWRHAIAAQPTAAACDAIMDAVKAYRAAKEEEFAQSSAEKKRRTVQIVHLAETLFSFLHKLRDEECKRFFNDVEPYITDSELKKKLAALANPNSALAKKEKTIRGWTSEGKADRHWPLEWNRDDKPVFGYSVDAKKTFNVLRKNRAFEKMLEERVVLEC